MADGYRQLRATKERMRTVTTPREVATEVYPFNGDDPNAVIALQQAFMNGWQASRADLAQHRDKVSRLLIDHEYSLSLRDGSICRCGYRAPRDPERGWAQQDWHREHLVDTLLAYLTATS